MTRSLFLLPILFQSLSVLGQWSGGASDSGCTTLVETTSVGLKKDNYLLDFADGSSSSAAVGYHYRVTVQVTTPSSYVNYNDVYLFGATAACGGWFGGLYYGKMFIGTQCNSGSDDAIFDDTVLATSTAYQMEWNYNPKSEEYHVALDGSLVMSGSASFAASNGYVSIGYGGHTSVSTEPWLGGLTSAKVEWCRVCESGCTAGNYESTACAYATPRVCTACTAITQCASGLTCSSGSNEVCATCNSGFFGDDCAPCREACSADQYELTACTTTSNRVCSGSYRQVPLMACSGRNELGSNFSFASIAECLALCDATSGCISAEFASGKSTWNVNAEGLKKCHLSSSCLPEHLTEEGGDWNYYQKEECPVGCNVCNLDATSCLMCDRSYPTSSTGPTECAIDYRMLPGKACAGRNELSAIYFATPAECLAACDDRPSCVSVEYAVSAVNQNAEGLYKCQLSSSCVEEYSTSESNWNLYVKSTCPAGCNVCNSDATSCLACDHEHYNAEGGTCTECTAACVAPQFEQKACSFSTNRVCGCKFGWAGANCDKCDVSYSGEDCQCSRYGGSTCRVVRP